LFTQRTGTRPHQLNLKGKMPQQFTSRFQTRGQNPRFSPNGNNQRPSMPFNHNNSRNPNFQIGESSHQAAGSTLNNPAAESNPSKPPRAPCQICGKTSHQALDCFHRMDFSYQGRHPPTQLAAMAAQTNAIHEDPEWFGDSGANAHITNNLNNLTIQQPFEGNDTVEVGNGSGLNIDNAGSTLLHTPNSVFQLNKLLHCPNASANLISIQRFCVDNHCYFILTASHFFVKDLITKATLLEGKTENGLYPMRFKGSSLKARRALVALLGIKTSSLIWHFRLGHPSHDIVSRVVKDFKLPVLNSVLDSNKMILCDSCQLGKAKKQPFTASNRQTLTPLSLIHTDIWTSPITSISGYKYYVIFIDDYSRYTWLYPLKAKSEVYECFVKFKLLVEKQFSSSIKQLQSDGGGEYTSSFFQAFLSKHGIIHRKSCPYTTQQNGLAERKLRHILETGLTLLAYSHLSNRYWVDAFLTSVFLINRLPTPLLDHDSPFSRLHQKEPNYQQLKVFGCKFYPLLRPLGLHKLQFRSKPCIFLGYCHAGYKCLDPITNKVYLSRHVFFDELNFPAKDEVPPQLPSQFDASSDLPFILPVSTSSSDIHHVSPLNSAVAHPVNTGLHPITAPTPYVTCSPSSSPHFSTATSAPLSRDADVFTPHHFSPTVPISEPASSDQPLPLLSSSPEIPAPSSLNLPLPPIQPMTTRAKTGSLKPKTFPEFHLYRTIRHPLTSYHVILQETEPSCFKKAAGDPRWQQAMTAEFEALISNGTWTLCPPPPHQHILTNKWVYRIKQKPDGSVERFKARLVARGYEQQCGIDYTETFSPVIKSSTIRVLLSLAIQFDWSIRQLDVSNAFLHGTLTETVYMQQPKGFVDQSHPHFVCKLYKAIYRLKQAPRAWFHRLSSFLMELGFVASLVDTSLFILNSGLHNIFMLIYVDDIIITGSNPDIIQALISKLQQEFPLKDLGPLHFFLGVQASWTATGLHLYQAKYIHTLLNRSKMLEAKPAKSPSPFGLKLSKFDGDPLPDPTAYRQIVGALQYCTLTRPDISFSVNQLCQHMHAPTSAH
jgi:hypothetical protein